jgi:hypothetical protein
MQQFDKHEDFGQRGSAWRRHARSIAGRQLVRLEKRSEPLFQLIDALHDVSKRTISLCHRRAIECSYWVVEASTELIQRKRSASKIELGRFFFSAFGFCAGALSSVFCRELFGFVPMPRA